MVKMHWLATAIMTHLLAIKMRWKILLGLLFVVWVLNRGKDMSTDQMKPFAEFFCGQADPTNECFTMFMRYMKFVQLLAKEIILFLENLVPNFLVELYQKAKESGDVTDDLLFVEPDRDADVHIAETMLMAINDTSQKFAKSLGKDADAYLVKKKLEQIKVKNWREKGLCIMEFGIDPSVVVKHIKSISKLTKMPKDLQDIMERAVHVKGSGVKLAEDKVIKSNGAVHYVIIAANRKANDSFDVGMAVFSILFEIAPGEFQKNKDAVAEFIEFADSSAAVDDVAMMSVRGVEQMGMYFHEKAIEMFMDKCPPVLKGFNAVRKNLSKQ